MRDSVSEIDKVSHGRAPRAGVKLSAVRSSPGVRVQPNGTSEAEQASVDGEAGAGRGPHAGPATGDGPELRPEPSDERDVVSPRLEAPCTPTVSSASVCRVT